MEEMVCRLSTICSADFDDFFGIDAAIIVVHGRIVFMPTCSSEHIMPDLSHKIRDYLTQTSTLSWVWLAFWRDVIASCGSLLSDGGGRR